MASLSLVNLHCLPVKGLTLDEICDFDTMIAHTARASPTMTPGQTARYHYLSFGWIVGGIVKFEWHGHRCLILVFIII